MPQHKDRSYFIVKHDLASFQALPGFVWNSGKSKNERPKGFRLIKKGDRWVSFAHTTGDARDRAVSLVSGFYQCTRELRYGNLTPKAHAIAQGKKGAWLVEGESFGSPFMDPVMIPPLSTFVKAPMYAAKTVTEISKQEFEAIRNYAQSHRFDPEKIPCLGRAPRSEQEVLAIIASDPERFGIKKIIRIQTRFPDMLVKLKGKAEEVHLELELRSSSFDNHGHSKYVDRHHRFKGDRKPVGVLCWIDDDQDDIVKRHVHRIYELRDLLMHRHPIRW